MGNVFRKDKVDSISREELMSCFKELNKSEAEKWKKKYEKLSLEYDILKEEHMNVEKRDVEMNKNSKISMLAINDYVEEEIMKTEANSAWVPDAIEKRVYISIYKTVMETLEQVSNTTTLNLFNHKITIYVEPLDKYD